MSKKSKKNRETTHIKPTSISRIASLIVATLAGVVQKAFQWMFRLTDKEEGRTALPKSDKAEEIEADGLPGSTWIFGCSTKASGEIAENYDGKHLSNFNDLLTDHDGEGEVNDIYYSNPLVASMRGADGKTTVGSIDDYWTDYKSDLPDPYTGSSTGKAEPL